MLAVSGVEPASFLLFSYINESLLRHLVDNGHDVAHVDRAIAVDVGFAPGGSTSRHTSRHLVDNGHDVAHVDRAVAVDVAF